MHHVLTLPRVRRRDTGEGDTEKWAPVAAPTSDAVETTAVATQRVLRRVDGVEIWSVVKLALLFYGCVFACLCGGVLMVWTAISTLGYVDRFEEFMRSIGFRGFEVSSGDVVFGLVGVAGSLTLLASFLTVVVAYAYNLVAGVGHGLVLRMSEPLPGLASGEPPAPVDDDAPQAA
jgi:hypothetical protein